MDVMNKQKLGFICGISGGVGLKSPLPFGTIHRLDFGSGDFSPTQITDPGLLHVDDRGRENV
ncbi:MAG: hypothetical protein RBQ76_04125 [Sulfurovum sp.]|jgi:hypothetical protein|nr:hypothetical protein [Sulfurovum sp.]MDY0402609.1 hypothetical protein [Sulfurovum sp.]